MTGFDLIKLVILIWFLAPFGYNASDMIFDLVSIKNVWWESIHDLVITLYISGCHPPHRLPQSHTGSADGAGLVPVPLLPWSPSHLWRLPWYHWHVNKEHLFICITFCSKTLKIFINTKKNYMYFLSMYINFFSEVNPEGLLDISFQNFVCRA